MRGASSWQNISWYERSIWTYHRLFPETGDARDLALGQAMGEPTLWLLMIAGFLMGALGLTIVICDGDRRARLSSCCSAR
jgi:hypothetical protein